MIVYEVAVAAPFFGSLTYAQPVDITVPLPLGLRVLVPLRNRSVTGYILSSSSSSPDLPYQIKPVLERLDLAPLFPEQLIPFFRWLADYYHYPLGEVIQTALPSGLRAGSGHEIILTEAGHRQLPAALDTLKNRTVWMDQLLAKEKLFPGTVKTIRRKAAMQTLLRTWQDAGWIDINEVILSPKVKEKTETVVRLNTAIQEILARYQTETKENQEENAVAPAALREGLKKSELKTLDLFFRHCKGHPLLPRAQLTRQYPGAGQALHSLAKAGLITLEEQRVYRDPFGKVPPFFPKPEILTTEQNQVVGTIKVALDTGGFHPFLLHGVTGCGKTEVYLRATEHCLACKKSVLVLVPEIALSSQLEGHFYSRFGDTLAILHSGISIGERFDQWQRVLQGKIRIVIGARSAVFAPLAKPGLVIVDEEHEPAYKQDDGLRYNGRDMAVLRAKFADCPVLLASATPSVTSFYHAEQGKYRLLTMTKRIHDQVMPEVTVIDLREKQRERKNAFFSQQLFIALQENLENRQQSLLFVNRRGYAAFMLCRDCGYIIQCHHCKVSLTHHQSDNRLLCHYCGYSTTPNLVCPDCGSGSVVGLGVGSERIEQEVRRLFPAAGVARLDSDTTKDRKEYLRILDQVRNHEVDILVGTQMVAKGLHFPAMTLVGIIWADSGLGIPDYKAAERSYQLLAQVSGRAGRGEHSGRVIVQTHQPQHYVIEFARSHAYKKLYKQEIEFRDALSYPPFGRLINIRFSGEKEENVAITARQTAVFLRNLKEKAVDIMGPVPAPLSMIKKRFRWQLLLKSREPERLHRLCDLVMTEKKQICRTGVRMSIDVDPENMM
ncbi:replication restart DNA helicase PriA [Candidatus Electrothrix marina]|uniref:Replication restart protein PriA n=1 Tax=Candidatus Electrothrix marina TaxID=1859130 RepID=A0A444JER2_9BACT|nr:replication restart DNA helicase PriA [Candidatus Electrothrix marina]